MTRTTNCSHGDTRLSSRLPRQLRHGRLRLLPKRSRMQRLSPDRAQEPPFWTLIPSKVSLSLSLLLLLHPVSSASQLPKCPSAQVPKCPGPQESWTDYYLCGVPSRGRVARSRSGSSSATLRWLGINLPPPPSPPRARSRSGPPALCTHRKPSLPSSRPSEEADTIRHRLRRSTLFDTAILAACTSSWYNDTSSWYNE
jgi:hypothetical protein